MKAQGVKRLAALFCTDVSQWRRRMQPSWWRGGENAGKGRPPAFHFKSPILSRRPRGGCSLHRALCSSSTSLRLINDWLAPMKLEQLRQYDSVTLLLCGDWMRQNRGCSCCTMMRLGEEINGRQNRCSARWPKLLFNGPAQVGKTQSFLSRASKFTAFTSSSGSDGISSQASASPSVLLPYGRVSSRILASGQCSLIRSSTRVLALGEMVCPMTATSNFCLLQMALISCSPDAGTTV